MVKKVDLHFSGYKTGNETSIPTLWEAYNTIADQNNLLKVGFSIKFEPSGEHMIPVGVFFNYSKLGLNESNLEAFNAQWEGLSTQYGFIREPTQIRYYEG